MTPPIIPITAELLEDRPDWGTVETRGGYFDGERHAWPHRENVLIVTRSLKRLNEVISGTYRDSGEVRFEKDVRIRVFDLAGEGIYTQTVPED